jgi:hypothetical protein
MLVCNKTTKIMGIGELSLLPDAIGTIPPGWERNPVVLRNIELGRLVASGGARKTSPPKPKVEHKLNPPKADLFEEVKAPKVEEPEEDPEMDDPEDDEEEVKEEKEEKPKTRKTPKPDKKKKKKVKNEDED